MNRDELKNTIISLCSVMSVSGYESHYADALRQRIAPYFDEHRTDAVGNHLFVRRCGREQAPLVMIDTHYDEIGMLVTDHLEGGFLRFTSVGGLSPSVLQGADVVIYGKKVIRGVISSTPPHLRTGMDESLSDPEELLIDTGYGKEILLELCPAGTPVGFSPCYGALLNDRIMGKSFDNKACAAAAILAIANTPKESLSADVALCLSCYEETSALGGIAPAVYALEPNYAMVVDVNLARVPDTPKRETVPLGEGISLSVSAATDRRLTAMTEQLCKEREIPYCMIAAPTSTGTNAATVQLVGKGVPVVDVGLPLASMHTYNEVIGIADAEALCKLISEFICSEAIAEEFSVSDIMEKEEA
ncbi:MAG: hypothetical protein IKA76_06680 [Clostridia bacterium]|nr:hypothetical protein [Clostridia bacterium]